MTSMGSRKCWTTSWSATESARSTIRSCTSTPNSPTRSVTTTRRWPTSLPDPILRGAGRNPAGPPPDGLSHRPALPARPGDAQDLVERLDVAHRVVDRVVVVGGPPEPLPALRFGPVAVQSGPEITDAPGGVAERIVHPGPVEQAGYPLPVVSRVVADED